MQRGHPAEPALVDEVGRLQPVAGREHAVARRGGAAALHVAEHGHARLVAGALLDLPRELAADAAELHVAELVGLARLLADEPALAGVVGQLVALADDDDREVEPALVAPADLGAGLLDGDRVLGDQDHVGAAGDPAHHGDPAGVPPHHLDDHHAVVRLGGRVQAVDRLGRDRHGGVEAEGVVGGGEVVVDRLRHADDREVLLAVEPGRDAERVLAPDRDERVERGLAEVLQHAVDRVRLEGVRPRRADDRPAPREDPRDLAGPQWLDQPLHEPLPAGPDPEHLVPVGERPAADRPDDRVQAGAVASAGEHADPHGPRLCRRWESNPHGPRATGF